MLYSESTIFNMGIVQHYKSGYTFISKSKIEISTYEGKKTQYLKKKLRKTKTP